MIDKILWSFEWLLLVYYFVEIGFDFVKDRDNLAKHCFQYLLLSLTGLLLLIVLRWL